MKNLWPVSITIGLIVFMCGTMIMVYIATHQDFALVSADYYEQGLKYDQIKEKNENRIKNSADMTFDYDSLKQVLKVTLSEKKSTVSGKLLFYNPVVSTRDFTVEIKPDSGVQTIDLKNVPEGFWKIKADWVQNDVAYLQEYKLMKK